MGIRQRIRKRREIFQEKWDSICLKCGRCCCEKHIRGNSVIYDLGDPCTFLDTDTGLCRVYSSRYEQNPRCQPVGPFKAMFASYLPRDCAYVQWARRHHIRWAVKRNISYIHEDLRDGKLDDALFCK
jgi:uncharacterized protein